MARRDFTPGVTPPLQERSRATLERCLDAAETLLREVDFGALRIEDVLREAGVSTGSFYARFADKNAMLAALLDRYRADLERLRAEDRDRAAVPATLEARCRVEVRHRMRRLGRVGLMRTVVLECRRESEVVKELTRLTRQVNARIVDFFRPCFGEVGHADPERAVLRGTYFVGAVCRDRMLFARAPHAASVPLPLADLEDELTRMLESYLRG